MRSSEVSSEGDVELSLGLTLGGQTNVNKKYSNSQPLTANAAATTDFAGIFCGDGFTAGSRSRQIEAKKDQIESQRMVKKRQKVDDRQHQHHQAETNPNPNPNPKINLIPNHNPNSNVTMNMIPNHSTTSTATNATAGGSDQPTAPPPYGHFPVMPMQYSYHPYANGYGFPYMVPWCMNVPLSGGQDGATSGRNVFQPVPTRSFHTFQGIATSGKEVVQSGGGGGGEDGCGGSIHRAHSMTGSQGSSFSAVSEFQSPSQQQGGSSSSSDTRGGCGGGGAGQVNQGSTEEKSPLFQQHSSSNQLAVESSIKQTTTTADNSEQAKKKEKKSSMVSPMPEMPCVSTTGDGPNGKKITGFLYRYNKTEVSIVCVCHGSFFSPAEFIKHAGGTDVSHPLRHIVIVPS